MPSALVRDVPKEFGASTTRSHWPVRGVLQRRWNLVSEMKIRFVVVAVFSGVARLDLSEENYEQNRRKGRSEHISLRQWELVGLITISFVKAAAKRRERRLGEGRKT